MSPSPASLRRSRSARTIFAALATVAAAVPVVVLGAADAAWAAGSVSVSSSVDLDPAGETVTVSGSGFDSSRGVYVMFCRQVGTSGTAAGRPGGGDCSPEQHWVVDPGPGVPPSGTVAWSGDGTFSLDVALVSSWGEVDCRAEGTTCGIVTRNDHREPGAYDQDTFTPVTFAADAPTGATVAVSPDTDLDAAGDSVTVTGTGFPDGQGVYVRFCEAPGGAVGTAAGRPSAAACDGDGLWVTPDPPPGAPLPTIVDGAFSVEVDVAGAFAGESSVIDCTTSGACGVFVRRDHVGGAADFSLDSFTPLAFDPDTDAPVVDPPDPPSLNDVVVELSQSTDLADGQTITVDGSEFVPDQGVYVQFCAKPGGQVGTAAGRADRCFPDQDGVHTVWVSPVAGDGTFTTPLTVEAGFTPAGGDPIDCTVESCGVFVRRDHTGGTTDYSQDAYVPVTFGDGTAPPAPPATLTADRTTDLDPAGDAIAVEGAGYRPADPVFVAVCDTAVANYAACDYDNVVEVTPEADAAARALGDPGTFSANLEVRAAFGDTDCADPATACAVATWSVTGGDGTAEVALPISFRAAAGTGAPSGSGSPVGTASPSATGTIARTGMDADRFVGAGLILVGLGALFVLGARRRRAVG